jgi:hypothetical protein
MSDRVWTWVSHALASVPIGAVGAAVGWVLLWIGAPAVAAAGGAAAVTYYLIREAGQIWERLWDGEPLAPVDHFMDVASPTAMAVLLALIAAFVVGCAPLVNSQLGSDPINTRDRRQVAGVPAFYTTVHQWERTPWARIADPIPGPYHVIVATDGSACLVTPEVWAVAQPGEFRGCPTGWRRPRP